MLFTALVSGAWLGGKEALRRFVWENPDYFLHEINFTTDGALTRDQVLSAAGLDEGRNIFTVHLAETRAAIEKLPQVESAVVQRLLPNRMTVTISERRPIAWVTAKGDEDPSSSDRSFLIDARGIILRSRVVLPEYYHLPIISGFETGNLVPGRKVNALEMQAALELVRLSAESPHFQARNIDLAKGYCLVVTDQKRAKITFGLERVEAQLNRLYRYLDRAAEDHRELQTVNLIVERNVPVTFVEPDGETPAGTDLTPPKPAKPAPPAATSSAKTESPKARSVDTPKKPEPPVATPLPSGRKPTPANPLRRPFRLNP